LTRRGRAAVFIDKDGTLIDNVPYNVDPSRIVLRPSVREGMRALRDAGFPLFVVSNQPGVAYGLFAPDALDGVARRIDALLAADDVRIEGYRWCPHHPAGVCSPY